MVVTTPAIVLATLRYSETSKIVRLATRDHGVQSAIAKGALRPRSRFGASLQLLSTGQAHLLLSNRRDLHTLTAFDLTSFPVALASHVARFATATALAELMIRVGSTEPHPEAYDCLAGALDALARAESAELPELAIHLLWRLVASLGFEPGLSQCLKDGAPLDDGPLAFSAADGGALCARCARTADSTTLPATDRAALQALISPEGLSGVLDARHAAAHRRLLARYIHYHVAEGGQLNALEFWVGRAWTGA
jgi:DNA repair protein RecO (recombination protein O)